MALLVESIVLSLSVILVESDKYCNGNFDTRPLDNLKESTNAGFIDCSISHDFAQITNVSLTPYPLKRGQNVSLQAVINIKKVAQWGIVHLTLTHSFNNYTNITFIDEKFNLCDLCVDVIKTHCPLQPGIYHFSYSRELLKIFWPGQYYGKATVYNEKGVQMYCLAEVVKIEN